MISLDSEQLGAISRMKNGCILWGGVGTGKSRTALGYFYKEYGGDLKSKGKTRMINPPDLYIITTAKKRDSFEWDSDMEPFLLKRGEGNFYDNKVIIDSWNNIQKYSEVKDSFFIFDEQRVVGYGAWTKAFLKIAKSNKWIMLSATPGDKWEDYIPVFIANGFYKNKTDFIAHHVVYKPRVKFPQVLRYLEVHRLIRLRDSVLVPMNVEMRAIQHHNDVTLPYDIQKYRDITRSRFNPITNTPIESASEYCYLLRRIVNSDEARSDEVLRICEENPKVIIFYNFNYELEILKSIEYPYGTTVAEWNGHKHQNIPKSGRWVYLVQYTAGAEGWNCIETNIMIFYSQSYSYKTTVQASGRINRRNTPFSDLYYYHFKSRAPIDSSISRALSSKKEFNVRSFTRNLSFSSSKNTEKFDE